MPFGFPEASVLCPGRCIGRLAVLSLPKIRLDVDGGGLGAGDAGQVNTGERVGDAGGDR